MSKLQEIFASDHVQKSLDAMSYFEAKIFLSAIKAAAGLADEVNRAENPDLDKDPENLEREIEENGGAEPPKPARGGGGGKHPEAPDEEPEEDIVMGFEDIITIAGRIYDKISDRIFLANANIAVPASTPAQPPAPAVAPTHRKIPLVSQETPPLPSKK